MDGDNCRGGRCVYVCMFLYVRMCACMCVCIRTIHLCMCTFRFVYEFVLTYVHVYLQYTVDFRLCTDFNNDVSVYLLTYTSVLNCDLMCTKPVMLTITYTYT